VKKKRAVPGSGAWTKKNDFAGEKRANGIAFTIGNKGYVGHGNNATIVLFNDFWEYTPQTDTWVKEANLPEQMLVCGAVSSFSIGNKGYALAYNGDFFEYDPAIDAWTRKANFPGGIRPGIAGLPLAPKGMQALAMIKPANYLTISGNIPQLPIPGPEKPIFRVLPEPWLSTLP
jgi:N-acetylneuraminic acid mutarotase